MKKILFIFIGMCLIAVCLTLLGVDAQAAEIKASGRCGTSATWSLDTEGNLVISGTGQVWRYWHQYASEIKTVTFNEGITHVGMDAFWDYSSLVSVTIPTTMTYIDEYAFHYCENIETVYISDLDAWNKIKFVAPTSDPTCYGAELIVVPKDMQHLELTVDTLDLEYLEYTSAAIKVNDIPVQWVRLGNFTNGLQMASSDGTNSMIWNTSALPSGINKIVFYSSSTQSNGVSEAMFVRFGNHMKGEDEETVMMTFHEGTSYTVYPDSDEYTYFFLEWISTSRSYWDSIVVYYGVDAECSHSYQTMTKEATCKTEGNIINVCTYCGDSYLVESISVIDHAFGQWTYEIQPTCEVDGLAVRYCKFCDMKETQVVLTNGHSVGDWVIGTYPTCTSKGIIYKQCSNCNLRETDVLAATGHAFVNGKCSVCGANEVNPAITLKYPSLSFEDEILYNVYYTIENVADVVEMGLITFTQRLDDGTIDTADQIIPGYVSSGSTYMVQSKGIPAKNLGDAVYFKVYAKLADGSYVYSNVAGYHAVAYANTVLDSDATLKAKGLVVAMLNYGASAQEYFGYKTDSLMNANLTAEQQALASVYDESMVQPVMKAESSKVGSFVMNGGYSNIFPTVSFEGAFSINFYFTPDKAVDSTPTLYYWDAETYNNATVLSPWNATGVISMEQDGSDWGAAVEGIAAKAMDDTIYVAGFYTSDGVAYPTGIIAYSLGDYCKTVAANGTAFGAATAVYGYYAKAFFN